MKSFLFVAFLLFSVCLTEGKIFSKCDLAQELDRQGFSRASLPDWVCLVDAESSFNSGAVGGPNTDGSYDYGLFQINDMYWCTNGQPGKECNADCRSFLDDDITDDVRCVNKIFSIHGFEAWYGWLKKCQGQLPSIDECF